MENKCIFQGAESRIYIENQGNKTVLVKERFKKQYRNEQLDIQLTKERMKAESRNMAKCKQAGLKTPDIHKVDFEKRLIYMEYIEGSRTTKQVIDELQNDRSEESQKKLKDLMHKIGQNLTVMHGRGIVHGDLTTSNMLVSNEDLYFIDFGLSSSAASFEEKGVDLYVLERALLSTHDEAQQLFDFIIEAYKQSSGDQGKKVMIKLKDIRARGRKRTMVG